MAFASKALILLALSGIPLMAQMHNVVLTWKDSSNPVGSVTYNVYKALGTCPAAGTAPSTVIPPFAQTATGLTALNYTDIGGIAVGQSFCYYVTAQDGYIVNSATGLVMPNESAPSNYAVATLLAAGSTPLKPGNVTAVLQ